MLFDRWYNMKIFIFIFGARQTKKFLKNVYIGKTCKQNIFITLRGFGGGAPEKFLRFFCKVLSIFLWSKRKRKRGGPGPCQMFAGFNCKNSSRRTPFDFDFTFYTNKQIWWISFVMHENVSCIIIWENFRILFFKNTMSSSEWVLTK